MNIRKKLRKQHVVFLRWMVSQYGKQIKRTQFAEIGFEFKHPKQTICNYMQRLEETGCVHVEVVSPRKRTITIDIDKCNEQLNLLGEELLNVKK